MNFHKKENNLVNNLKTVLTHENKNIQKFYWNFLAFPYFKLLKYPLECKFSFLNVKVKIQFALTNYEGLNNNMTIRELYEKNGMIKFMSKCLMSNIFSLIKI